MIHPVVQTVEQLQAVPKVIPTVAVAVAVFIIVHLPVGRKPKKVIMQHVVPEMIQRKTNFIKRSCSEA
jgi:hypothetical protein